MHSHEETLKKLGLSSTKTRISVLSAFDHGDAPLTAEEVCELANETGKVSVATVYRTLDLLTEYKVLLRSIDLNGSFRFQLNRPDHIHQLTCVRCGETITIHACPVEEAVSEIAKNTGYDITGHSLEIYGICPRCKEKEQKESETKSEKKSE